MSQLSLTSPYNGRDCFFCLWWLDLYLQDQYINHIINETGATVVLRGRGSGHLGSTQGEGGVFLPAVLLVWAANSRFC